MTDEGATEIMRLGPGDALAVAAAGHLFDGDPDPQATAAFLARDGHHLLVAYRSGTPAGFVTGIETAHPDKGVEMLLYELGVAEPHRRKGVGRSLVRALLAVAAACGCHGMWVPIDRDNDRAIATYRSAGALEPEEAAIMSWKLTPPGDGPSEPPDS